MQRSKGNPANGSLGDPIQNAIFRSPEQAKGYKGVHGQIGFVLCAGNMRGILFDGKTCGGVAHWPLFAPNTDFSNFYALADGCITEEMLTGGCPAEEPPENPALCLATKMGATLIPNSNSLAWDGTLISASTTNVVVEAGQLIVTDFLGAQHVLMADGTPVTGVAAGATQEVLFTGTTIVTTETETARCVLTNRAISANTTVPA